MGLEILDELSTGSRCSESSFGFTYVLFGTVVALCHVFGVTVNVMSDRSGFACRVEFV